MVRHRNRTVNYSYQWISKWEWVGFVVISTYYFSSLYLRFYSTLNFNEIMNQLNKFNTNKKVTGCRALKRLEKEMGCHFENQWKRHNINGDGILHTVTKMTVNDSSSHYLSLLKFLNVAAQVILCIVQNDHSLYTYKIPRSFSHLTNDMMMRMLIMMVTKLC